MGEKFTGGCLHGELFATECPHCKRETSLKIESARQKEEIKLEALKREMLQTRDPLCDVDSWDIRGADYSLRCPHENMFEFCDECRRDVKTQAEILGQEYDAKVAEIEGQKASLRASAQRRGSSEVNTVYEDTQLDEARDVFAQGLLEIRQTLLNTARQAAKEKTQLEGQS